MAKSLSSTAVERMDRPTWQPCHPTEISHDLWIAWLSQTPSASPYLLPEWSLFWEDVWPKATAQLWRLIDSHGSVLAAVPVVHRRRWGFHWYHAQPYGTTCGPILPQGPPIPSELLLENLLHRLSHIRPVEISTNGLPAVVLSGMRCTELCQSSWIIRGEAMTASDLTRHFSGSHRRNIEKGAALNLRVTAPATEDDIARVIRHWQDRERAPRFILLPRFAAALYSRFAPTGAMYWRIAWAGERPVAGVLFLVHDRVAASVDTIVDRDHRFRGAGHWLVAESLRELLDRGVTTIDLGGVPGGNTHPGLDEFKAGWGAAPEETVTHLYRRPWYQALRRV